MAQAGVRQGRSRAGSYPKGKQARNRIAGYARLLSHPAYERLLSSEVFLRRLVPVLIVIFLAVVAFARWAQLTAEREYIRASTETADVAITAAQYL